MRGQVLGVDRASAAGQIAGDDGQRYSFKPEDWSDRAGPGVGAFVDFEAEGTRALRIYHVPGSVPVRPVTPTFASVGNDRNKYVAAVLAFVLGTLGVHRFYVGRTGTGIIMLVLTCTIVGLLVTGLWAFIDMIRYLIMSDAEFAERYPRLPKT